MLRVPQVGLQTLCNLLTGNSPFSGSQFHLYVNNWVPGPGDTVANYTEAVFGGYAPVPIGPKNPSNTTNLNGTQLATPGTQPGWEATGTGLPVTVFGGYLTDSTHDLLLCAVLFDQPITISTTGAVFFSAMTLGLAPQQADPPGKTNTQDTWDQSVFGALVLGGAAEVNSSV